MLILMLFYPNSVELWHKSTILWLICGILLIIPFFWGTLILRNYSYNIDSYSGVWLLLFLITIVWEIDSIAYIVGKQLGYHKCLPKISPNKTWEGYIGSIVLTICTSWIIINFIPLNIEPIKLFKYSIIIIAFAILGDLTISMFKRIANVKDSSQLIPGHGGILDVIDSLIGTTPIFSCLILSEIDI